jgi:hypothetical protein
MDKFLIFYKTDNFIKKFDLIGNKTNKNNKIFFYKSNDPYQIMKGAIYNPPFFKYLIYEQPKNKVDVEIAWNSTLMNGYLIIPESFGKYLNNKQKNFKFIKIDNKKYCMYHKSNADVFIFYDKYRVIDFSIIGVEKGGTTYLMKNLAKVKSVNMAMPNHHPGGEMHYLDSHMMKKHGSIKWLQSHFDYKNKLVGDKNPNLIYLYYTQYYLSKLNPYLKMVLVLRNPIDRAYSEWHMFNHGSNFWKNSGNFKSFEDAINDELNLRLNEIPTLESANYHHLQRGLYYKQIKNLLKYFPKENLLIVLNDDLKNKEKETFQKILEFIGMKDYNLNNFVFEKKVLEGTYTKNQKEKDINTGLRKKMIDFFKDDVKKLEKLLKMKLDWCK